VSPKHWEPTRRRLGVTSQQTKLFYMYLHVSDLPVASFFLYSLKLITFSYELTHHNNIHESRRMLLACDATHQQMHFFTVTCATVVW